jgi:hypothetical protein
MSEEIKTVREAILIAFASSDRPTRRQIALHKCEECQELRELFGGLTWDSVPMEVIDSNFDKLPLFSAKAYRYFLPAYILRCLDEFDWANTVCEYTIYSLSPSALSEENRDWYSEKQRYFSDDQKRAVASFLRLVRDSDSFLTFHEDAEAGLKLWSND